MIINKEDFLRTLTEEQLTVGYLKFNIPDEDNPTYLNGEVVWDGLHQMKKENMMMIIIMGKSQQSLWINQLNIMED